MKPSDQPRRIHLPEDGYLRLPQILGDLKADPPIYGLYPVSESTWHEGVRDGIYPKGIKLSSMTIAWRVRDILDLIERRAMMTDDDHQKERSRRARVR